MITLDTNNFGGASVTLRDFQSSTLCVLSGKITVDPAHSSYMAATRLELDLPVGFTMVRSAISNAILVSNAPIYRYGTVLQCWIEDNRLCIEKLTLWDTFGPYEIYINCYQVLQGRILTDHPVLPERSQHRPVRYWLCPLCGCC